MRKIWIFLSLWIFIFSFCGCEANFEPLDVIHDYKITVKPNDDGTLHMTYYLEWEVLDDGKEGLSWIVVGVPNRYVSNITALTDNIKDIYYTSNDGAQIRLDLDRTYHAGDVLELKFSFLQSRIFTLNKDEVEYSFIPGWFDEIKVKRIQVLWKANNVLYADTKTDGDWLIWKASLDYGESITCNVKYARADFPNLDPRADYSSQTMSDLEVYMVIGVFVFLAIACVVVGLVNRNPYDGCRGFSGRINWYHFRFGRRRGYRRSGKLVERPRIVSSGSGSTGRGCACACACACAGGGRAGCSRKDFTKALKI